MFSQNCRNVFSPFYCWRIRNRKAKSTFWTRQSLRTKMVSLKVMRYIRSRQTLIHIFIGPRHTLPTWNAASIPYSQTLRLRWICSDTDKLRTRLNEYTEFLVAWGYNRGDVLELMRRVLLKNQEQCLEIRDSKELLNRTPLVTTYNPHTPRT